MDEYKPNSHRSKEAQMRTTPEKRTEKVISGSARVRKKNEIRKFADAFLSEDIASIKSYIFRDVLVPLVKKAISDTVETILYPGGGGRKEPSSRTSYGRYYEERNDRRSYSRKSYGNSREFEDVIVNTRGEAQEVLDKMNELMGRYGLVRVADLYEAVGIDGSYTAVNYGWTDIRSADVIRLRDGGYLLKMPRALPLD